MFQAKLVEEDRNTHFVFSNFFWGGIRAVIEVMWKNTVEPDKSQKITWRMRFACCITKATDTLRICNTHYFFHCNDGFHERAIMLRYRTLPVLLITEFETSSCR